MITYLTDNEINFQSKDKGGKKLLEISFDDVDYGLYFESENDDERVYLFLDKDDSLALVEFLKRKFKEEK